LRHFSTFTLSIVSNIMPWHSRSSVHVIHCDDRSHPITTNSECCNALKYQNPTCKQRGHEIERWFGIWILIDMPAIGEWMEQNHHSKSERLRESKGDSETRTAVAKRTWI
jgi:hypothetical protein